MADPNALDIGAQKLLGNGLYRRVGGKSFPLCESGSVLARVSQALERRGGLGKGRAVEYQLALAARLPHPPQSIVKDVAKVAFAESGQQSEIFNDLDIRPYARAVLASFGAPTREYSEVAIREMSTESSMGTGAAQVAAAAGHPDALPWVARSIQKELEAAPAGSPIPWSKRNRLYELAWAIAYAGENGKPYLNSIEAIMRRKVESKAFPFGMVSHDPKQLCRVLEYVADREALQTYSYCTDESLFEQ